MKRYRVKVLKKYTFDLDGKNKDNVREQLDYIINETQLLERPYVEKNIKIRIKKINKKKRLRLK